MNRNCVLDDIRVAVVVPTRNPGLGWLDFCTALQSQTLQCNILVVDSESSQPVTDIARHHGFSTRTLPVADFNHGGTRWEAAVDCHQCWQAEIIVFLTQDAILERPDSLETLICSFRNSEIAAAYGCHLPQAGASRFEAVLRQFNYPDRSRTVRSADIPRLGFRAAFCSNTFAAYRWSDLAAVGGFPTNVILGEDAVVAARLLLQGRAIHYAADARVHHSHTYSPWQQAQRYFDTGVFHADQQSLLRQFGSVGGEGRRYAQAQLQAAYPQLPQLADAVWRLLLSWLLYQLGKHYRYLPLSLRSFCSMHTRYWADQSQNGSRGRQRR